MTVVVLDTGALIALDRADRTDAVLIAAARATNAILTVPAGCVAQAWRNPARHARLSSFLRLTNVDVIPIDDAERRYLRSSLGPHRRHQRPEGQQTARAQPQHPEDLNPSAGSRSLHLNRCSHAGGGPGTECPPSGRGNRPVGPWSRLSGTRTRFSGERRPSPPGRRCLSGNPGRPTGSGAPCRDPRCSTSSLSVCRGYPPRTTMES